MKPRTVLLFACVAAVAQPVVIKTTTLIDGKGHVFKNRQIAISAGKIAAVSEGKGKADYDLSGLTVLPGFIDTHVHLGWHFNKDSRLDQGGPGSKESPQEAALYAAANAYGEAKALGLRGVVHAHASDGAASAIRAGCTSIEHGTFIDDKTFDLMVSSGTFFDPNFLVLHNYLDNKPKFLGIGNYTEEGFTYMEKALPLIAQELKKAGAHKVKIVLGTDAVAGAHGHNAEEFIYRVKDGGQDPMAAINSGTSVAADSLRLGSEIGSIAPGMQADIVALDGNPIEDITAVRRVVFVMKGGKVYKNVAAGH